MDDNLVATTCRSFYPVFSTLVTSGHKEEHVLNKTTTHCARLFFLLTQPLPSQSMSSQETLGRRKSSLCAAPRALGQLFILLQYQTLAHRIKVMVRKAENLAKLSRMPGAAGMIGPFSFHPKQHTELSTLTVIHMQESIPQLWCCRHYALSH